MSIVKVTEISAASPESFDDAVRQGLARACKTLKNVQGAWVSEQKVVVKNQTIDEWRVDLKVSFLLED